MRKEIITLLILSAVMPSCFANYVNMVNALNPVSYWRLDETAGIVAGDEKSIQDGQYNNGVLLDQEGALSLKCNNNKAVHFDGGNDYVSIGHNSAFELASGTIQFWFKETGAILQDKSMFSKDSAGFDNGGHITFLTNHYGNKELEVRLQSTSDHYYVVSSDPIMLNTWYMATFTFGAGGMQLYINDTLIDTNPFIGGLVGNDEPIALGANTWATDPDHSLNGLEGFWSGYMDEVVIYDSVLTQQQIKDLYDFATTCVPEPCTIALLGLGALAAFRRRK
ncbi:MAG: LamG domain-containing protein [Sedimentisphaerales bacterium]|nr:LamG domain-containing protein [Sedimentisphaerales bacterium]